MTADPLTTLNAKRLLRLALRIAAPASLVVFSFTAVFWIFFGNPASFSNESLSIPPPPKVLEVTLIRGLVFSDKTYPAGRVITIPLGMILFLTAILPIFEYGRLPWFLIRRWRRRRREDWFAAAGLCVRCGYDLRATPDRCPECGTMKTTASP